MGVKEIMRAIFGTDARCKMRDEREVTDKMLSEVERKINRLDTVLDRSAANLDEALQQITARRH